MASASRTPSRVMTFNIGRGAVGRRWGAAPPGATFDRLDEVAEAIGRLDPEVVALQEVHEGDVPELVRLLADRSGLTVHPSFAPTLPTGHPRLLRAARAGDDTRASAYGVALLSRAPVTGSQVVPLPSDGLEPRVAQVVSTALGPTPVTVVNVHLSTEGGRPWDAVLGRPSPQRAQTDEVLALAARIDGPVVVLGDWNQEAVLLRRALRRVRRDRGSGRRDGPGGGDGPGLTLVSDPWRATTIGGNGFDHVLVGRGVRPGYRGVERATVSDHRPVLVALTVDGEGRVDGSA